MDDREQPSAAMTHPIYDGDTDAVAAHDDVLRWLEAQPDAIERLTAAYTQLAEDPENDSLWDEFIAEAIEGAGLTRTALLSQFIVLMASGEYMMLAHLGGRR